jgi:hypothetical protein
LLLSCDGLSKQYGFIVIENRLPRNNYGRGDVNEMGYARGECPIERQDDPQKASNGGQIKQNA